MTKWAARQRIMAIQSTMCIGIFLGATGLLHAQSQPASAISPPGIGELCGTLAHDHSYLFDSRTRRTLDRLNRDLREASSQSDRARTPEARRAAGERHGKASGRFLEMLAAFPNVMRVSIEGDQVRSTPQAPVQLPGDSGGILFQVTTGKSEMRCITVPYNLAETERPVPVDVAPDGVTWGVISLTNVPLKRSSLVLEFKRPGRPPVHLPFDVITPEPGRLKVTILSADTDKPAPAMVRLVWKTDGLDRRPSSAIELASQFDHQGTPSGRRKSPLPGKLGGYYWCVREPFDMVVPAGEWEITVRRGIENVPVVDTFTVKAGEYLEKTYKPRRWVDMRKLGWYSGDDHVHCQILSDDDAWRLMAYVQAEDIHLANIVKMGDIFRTWFEQRGFGREYRVVDGDYVLSPGQECPRTHDQIGHTLAMNTTSMVRDTDQYFLYDKVFDAVHAQGGLSGYAHVASQLFHVNRDMSINIPKSKVDFAEILQFSQLGTDLYYDFLNLGCKLTASAGSDVPWGGTVGEVRAYAYTGPGKPFTADAWFEAFKRGRTVVTDGPMLEFQVDDALPGDEILTTTNRKLHVKARTWGDPEAAMPQTLEILCHGEVIRKVESSDKAQKELSVEFDLESGGGFWVAARAHSRDGRRAHTTPVYVVRQGLRFWKLDAVDGLIARRSAALDEVEKIVADATKANNSGELEGDRTLKQLALQGPELLSRVKDARDIYARLEETAAKERDQRSSMR